MSTKQTTQAIRRAPNGAGASLHISLTAEERARVDELAAREQRTTGSTARLLLLRGLQTVENKPGQSLAG